MTSGFLLLQLFSCQNLDWLQSSIESYSSLQAALPGGAAPSGRYSEPVRGVQNHRGNQPCNGVLTQLTGVQTLKPMPSKTNFPDEFSLLFQSFFTSLFNIPQKGKGGIEPRESSRIFLSIYPPNPESATNRAPENHTAGGREEASRQPGVISRWFQRRAGIQLPGR